MRKTLALVIAVLLVGCVVPTSPTPTDVPPSTATLPVPTSEQPTSAPTATTVSTEVPTVEPTPAPTQEPTVNLLENPGFEGWYEHDPVFWGYNPSDPSHYVTFGSNFFPTGSSGEVVWHPFAADWPWNGRFDNGGTYITPNVPVPNICWPTQTSGCNPETVNGQGNYMTTCEFGDVKASSYPERVYEGEQALKFFSFYRTSFCGVWQNRTLQPGLYVFGAYVHAWSASDMASGGKTPDTYDGNSEFYLAVDFAGTGKLPINPEARTRIGTSPNVYMTGNLGPRYDEYQPIQIIFRVERATTLSLFILNFRNWPVMFNDTYVDNAYLYRISD